MPLSYTTGFFLLHHSPPPPPPSRLLLLVPEFVAIAIAVFPENFAFAGTMKAVLEVPLCNARIVFSLLAVDISKFRASPGEFSKVALSPGGQLLKQCQRFSIKEPSLAECLFNTAGRSVRVCRHFIILACQLFSQRLSAALLKLYCV